MKKYPKMFMVSWWCCTTGIWCCAYRFHCWLRYSELLWLTI